MTDQAKSSIKSAPLTSVRFLAALYVVCYHTIDRPFANLRDLATIHGRLLDLGYVSVSFFFTLSGYVLAVSYLPRNVGKNPFWIARFARIYPLFILTLLLDVPQYLAGIAKEIGLHNALHVVAIKSLFNTFLLQAWLPSMRSMDWPNWSISVEAFFYLLFPFLMSWAARLSAKTLATAALAIYIAGMTGVFLGLKLHSPADVLKFNPLFHLHAFVIGVFVGIARAKYSFKLHSATALLGLAALSVALVVAFYSWIPHDFIHDGMLAPAFACAILALDSRNRVVDTLMSPRWFVVLGEASYGLYLIHIPLQHIFYHFRIDQLPAVYPLYLLSAVSISLLSFYFLETPMRLLVVRHLDAIGKLRWRVSTVKEAAMP